MEKIKPELRLAMVRPGNPSQPIIAAHQNRASQSEAYGSWLANQSWAYKIKTISAKQSSARKGNNASLSKGGLAQHENNIIQYNHDWRSSKFGLKTPQVKT